MKFCLLAEFNLEELHNGIWDGKGVTFKSCRRSAGAWVAQLVKHPTLDLSPGLDLRVMSSSPALGSVLGATLGPAWAQCWV